MYICVLKTQTSLIKVTVSFYENTRLLFKLI